MWTSERARRAVAHGAGARAAALALAALLGAATAAGAQPDGKATVRLLGGGLDFGTVLPGTAPVTVAPWSVGVGAERGAPVFEITGEPGATVRIQFPGLSATLRGAGGGGVLTVMAYTAQFNTVNGPSGATSFTPSPSPVAFVLGDTGRGYVSLGATISATVSQARGSYAISGGGVIRVQ